MKYTVEFDKELMIERAVEQWVLKWCEKYHPEAFQEAEQFLTEKIEKFIETQVKENENK